MTINKSIRNLPIGNLKNRESLLFVCFLDDIKYLYSDPMIIETDKQEALKSYLKVKGYRPIISIFKEVSLIIQHEFREGNAVGKVMEAIKRPNEILPECKKIRHASLGSEYYMADVKVDTDRGSRGGSEAQKEALFKGIYRV